MATHDDNINLERAPKDRDNPYGMLRRATFDGSALTFEERGVLAYILMKPDNWQANIKDLMREGDIGRDKTYAIIKGLISKGYAERIEIRDDKGHFLGTRIKIYEQPLPEKPDTDNPHTDLPDTAGPDTENQEHNNKGSETITDQQPITKPLPKTDKKKSADAHPMTRPIIDAYVECLGYPPTPSEFGKIGKDAKHIAQQGHTPEDVRHAYGILQLDAYWDDKTISLGKILEKIANTKETMRNRKEADDGEDEDNGGWDADELAAIKAARAAGDYALAGQIGREGNKRWKERMSQVQGHRLDGR